MAGTTVMLCIKSKQYECLNNRVKDLANNGWFLHSNGLSLNLVAIHLVVTLHIYIDIIGKLKIKNNLMWGCLECSTEWVYNLGGNRSTNN